MLRNMKGLLGCPVAALDKDEAGRVDDFFFDDQAWGIRYLVVDTGGWLPGRKVLIAPAALSKLNWADGVSFPVNLTADEIKDSPDIDTDKPVSRQQEISLIDYYQWPAYWSTTAPMALGGVGLSPGAYLGPANVAPGIQTLDHNQRLAEETQAREREGDPHLQSANKVISYYIGATDGDLGHVEDFVVDDEGWYIRYLVIDTRNWLPGKKVLIDPRWIAAVSWAESKVFVDLPQEVIKNSPEYDPNAPLGRAYESQLYDYYNRPTYWTEK